MYQYYIVWWHNNNKLAVLYHMLLCYKMKIKIKSSNHNIILMIRLFWGF